VAGLRGLGIPEVGLVRQGSGGIDIGIAYATGPRSSGKAGTFSHTFKLTGGTTSYNYTAVGRLTTSRNPEVSGSKSNPGYYINNKSCETPILP
jgi:hypothetical protein